MFKCGEDIVIKSQDLKLLLQQAYITGYKTAKNVDVDYGEEGWREAEKIVESIK